MLKVYNTMSRQKEPFKPLEEGKVSIYCCGVTPYNHPHIGNARPFVTWDVIRRYFSSKGYQVRYIQNFTDVDEIWPDFAHELFLVLARENPQLRLLPTHTDAKVGAAIARVRDEI